MKLIIYTLAITIGLMVLAKATHYSERMEYINAHSCAVIGYEPDCKTKLTGGEYK